MARVDEVLADLQQAKNLRILVLDSCRDNPLAEQLKRAIGATRAVSIQRGLAKIDSPEGMIVSYATQAGHTAEDGNGCNSPYTAAFLKHIEEQDEIGAIFRRITADVYESTGREQLPELSLSFIGEFYLRGRVDIAVPVRPPAPDPCAAAGDHWKSTEGIGTVAAFEDHLARFPNCPFAGLAKARIESLKSKVAVVAPPPPTMPPISLAPCNGEPVMVALSSRSAKPLSSAEECALKPKDIFKECDKCPEMVVVPPGSFTMGSPASEKSRTYDEGPQHEVTIGKAFAVGKFHVTVEQFAAFVDETGYDAGSKCTTFWNGKFEERQGRSWRNPGFAQGGVHPAVCLNWNDAKNYVAWLARKTGKAYRLLTEAEWEYAARARTQPGAYPRYWFGNDEKDLCRYGNVFDQTWKKLRATKQPMAPCRDGYAYTSPVGSFAANNFGLYDMLGNADQWTEDCYNDSYVGAPTDGSAWTSGDCSRRVFHGGSWIHSPDYLRAASRFGLLTSVQFDGQGLRVGRTLTP